MTLQLFRKMKILQYVDENIEVFKKYIVDGCDLNLNDFQKHNMLFG